MLPAAADSDVSATTSYAIPPADLLKFWTGTLSTARAQAWPARCERVSTGLRLVTTQDVTFSGFGAHPIRAWYHRPADVMGTVLPTVVRYQGYGGGRGLSHQIAPFVLAGYGLLDVDTRGQGAGYSPGDTPDPVGSAPAHPGYLTRGILQREEYYYRRVFTDAVRAVEVACELGGTTPGSVVVTGASQGGGIALAAASLVSGLAGVMTDVPFLADFRRAAEICETAPYTELSNYLAVHPHHVERALQTLAYFDVSVLGRLAETPALFSVALRDQICPPATVYAAYNAYAGPKQLRVYPFNDHEGGHAFHEAEQLQWLARALPVEPS
jgi:cephalosporin-C deacetylase